MSLTLSSAWTRTVLKENWLVQLWYDDEAEDKFFGLALYDTTVEGTDTVFYEGAILNKPSVRESIDLENSTASTSSINLVVANFINGDGKHFSRQLFKGSNNYINRTVKIYIQPNDEPDLGDCLLVYTGKLTGLSHDASTINLSVTASRPWDNVMIPNKDDRTTNNIYKPVAYGDYIDNSTEGSTNAIYGTYITHPIKYCTEIDREQYYLTGQGANGTKGAMFWDKYLQKFSPIDDSSSVVGQIFGQNALKFPISSKKSNHFFLDSVRESPQSPATSSGWQNLEKIFITGEHAHYSNPSVGQSTTVTKYLYLNCPNIDGEATQLSFVIKTRQEGNVGSSNSLIIRIYYEDDTTQLGYHSYGSNDFEEVTANFQTEYNTQNKKMPDYVTVAFSWTAGSGSAWSAGTSEVRVFEARFETEYNYPDDATRKIDNKAQELLYSGGDGYVSDINSSAITEIHEAYRDILHRYTSYTGSNTPTNWSSGTNIDGAKDWKIRYWILEPTPLIQVLEKLQYEGGFIGRFDGQGNFIMIYIPDSISTSITLSHNDVEDINVTISDFNALTTKMDIEYQKHPAEDRYDANALSANATARADYNIQTKENIKNITLDAYVSPTINTTPGTKNDCFYRYYDHILGSPKLLVETTVVNYEYFGIDVGDILEIDFNSVVRPFGGSDWVGEDGDGYKFMVIQTNRTPGKLKIKLREIAYG